MLLHTFELSDLKRYLVSRLPGFHGEVLIEQFTGGQSNPTYRLRTGEGSYVLRKKPPGDLLPSAHAIDRESRIMTALAGSGVPVPRVYLYCDDVSIVGTEFVLMEYVPGRVFADPSLPGLMPAERSAIYDAMNDTLARLHAVDFTSCGLTDFGRPGNYYARQIDRWSRQYRTTAVDVVPEMDALMAWLPAQVPATERAAIVHGDFRLENLIFDEHAPQVRAVLDWELSTLGCPLADLAFNCMPYHWPPRMLNGLAGRDLDALGIPSEAEYVKTYFTRAGIGDCENWNFHMAFAFFRVAAILQGVMARALAGAGSSPDSLARGALARDCAVIGWSLAERG